MMKSIIDKLNEWVEPIRAWIESNYSNPLMWIGLFLAGLAIFFITYDALSKNK